MYHPSDFILCGKSCNDLPEFSRIKEIIVICGCAMFYVENFLTTGLCNHLLCYAISRTYTLRIIAASKILDSFPYTAHTFLGDRQMFIAMQSHVIL